MTPEGALAPGSTIGVLGGGQLGRMIALAAARLGLKVHIYAHQADEPACQVAAAATVADWTDEAALARFADAVDVVTYEFENVPAATAAFLAARKPVRPGPLALEKTQDRLVEKDFLRGLGIDTAPYAAVDDAGALARHIGQIGRPAILKTRRFGYDGKGQFALRDGSDVGAAFRALGGAPCILEGFVDFEREVSVVAARAPDGSFAAYDVCENEHENHILATTRAPAHMAPETAAEAMDITHRILDALDYVGVIAVEMFLVAHEIEGRRREKIVVNEIAPRVHNSGHWTIDGAETSQFEQHVRAICGWPLGSPKRRGRVEMRNLIGDDAHRWPQLAAEAGAYVHLYGKAEARAGRKMGHVTRVTRD
ncbi:MAG: 5-(carboxyamino)imidazole ribonucleotide synthase [Hyphomicrobiales bacterium]|nr:5-(carboxyamino)imidazole ribonucleotide synthase [Hyphomicrobiales bacterium]